MIKYLGHEFCKFNFITDNKYESAILHKANVRLICNNCNIIVYYGWNDKLCISSASNVKIYERNSELKFNCNDIIIKSIIQ